MNPDPASSSRSPDQNELANINQSVNATEGSTIRGITQIMQVFQGYEARDAQRNRERMLDCIESIWIQGILEASISQQISLTAEIYDELVEKPWEKFHNERRTQRKRVQVGVIEAYQNSGCSLLILGEAGAGKTTALLQLVKAALKTAREYPQKPIPIIFNLSSWSPKGVHFNRWLVDELRMRYYIPLKVARKWVENDELLLLLDGLDEVRTEQRANCVTAINNFRQQHGQACMVISSRRQDYIELPQRLMLQGAVCLQPPDRAQARKILGSMQAVDTAFQILEGIGITPLNLEILHRVTNQDNTINLTEPDVEFDEKRLWQIYLESMLARPRASHSSQLQNSILLSTLIWLAKQMVAHGQTIFYLEQLGPSWLSKSWLRQIYLAGSRIMIGMLIGIVNGLIYLIGGSPDIALPIGLITGLAAIGASLLAIVIPFWLAIISASLLTAVLATPYSDTVSSLLVGLFFGTMTGLAGISVNRIRLAEKLRWSWRRATIFIFGLFLGVILFGLSMVMDWKFTNSYYELLQLLLTAIPLGMTLLLTIGRSLTVDVTLSPNMGFQRSAKNALLILTGVTLTSLFCGLLIGLLDNKIHAFPLLAGEYLFKDFLFGILMALILGFPSALYVGGTACLQHLLLRLMLAASGDAPWKLIEVLDLAVERVLLRKAGGGYFFIHRLLMEYLVQHSSGGD